MSITDKYASIAERYGQMLLDDPSRETFFKRTFDRYQVTSVLDCSCGTGRDLLLFHSMGCNVVGSDLSDSMLKVSQKAIDARSADILLKRVDFHNLKAVHDKMFDAVVCLSNSINEIEVDPIRALESMKEVVRSGGIIVFDQGQTDFTMKDPPRYVPIVNDSGLSRLFTMGYHQDIMTVNIFDFIHDVKGNRYDFSHTEFKIRIRLYKEWKAMLQRCHLEAEYYGSWEGQPYNPEKSLRLIVVAKKV